MRLDARALVGILLMLVATGGSIAVWSSQQDTRAVLVATRDLPAGTTISADDLGVARARLDDSVYAAAIPASNLSSLVGRQLAEPAHVNQLLVTAQLSSHPTLAPGQLVLAIPVRAETAAGGRVRSGDMVAVLATDTKHDTPTRVILPRAMVYDTGREQSSSSGASVPISSSASAGIASWITVIVTQDEAEQLARARWSGELDVALLPPT